MADDDIYARIKGLVVDHTRVREAVLTPQSRLFQDLGMDGYDAEEFLTAYATEFGVDMAGFRFDDHFGPEAAFNPLVYLWWALFNRKKLQPTPIALADLARSARDKRWSAPAWRGRVPASS